MKAESIRPAIDKTAFSLLGPIRDNLSPQQIEGYLLNAGEEFAALHAVLHSDTNLQELTQFWLTRLACQMMQHHNQELFYIEQLQPDWLPNGWPRIAYRGIGGLLYGLLGSLIVGAVYGDLGWIFGGLVGALIGVVGLSGGRIIERSTLVVVAWSLKAVRRIVLITLS